MTGMRERPSDAETASWVAETRRPVMSHARSSRWRRLSRPLVAGSVAGAVAVGGIAYAAVERTRTSEAPPTVRGNSVIEIGRPNPGDQWLNVSISYRCQPGERFELRDGDKRVAWADCDQQSFPDDRDPSKLLPGPDGLARSIPVGDVRSTRLTMVSTLSDEAVVIAEFGPTSAMSQPEMLPPNGPDGELDWDLPTYPVNEFGLTVGNITMREGPGGAIIPLPQSAYPDLIPYELDGREVYVRSEAFILELPGRPGELDMAELDRARGVRYDSDGRQFFRAYEADGKTPVGWVGSEFQRTDCSAC